jgi:hypothetical protein
MWVSDEPFGWATYHYGRWGHDKDLGWFWVPDKHWAPAWVYWRRSRGHVAWAPLPPSGNGTEVSANINCCAIPSDRWTAVPIDDFLSTDLSKVVVHGVLRGAKPLGTVNVEDRILVNKALSVASLEADTGSSIPVYEVRRIEAPDRAAASQDNPIVVFSPVIR